MSFTINPITNDTAVVSVGKNLDFRNAADFKGVLHEQFGLGTRFFILDFSQTSSFDSTGIGSLFTLYRRLVPAKGAIMVASASGIVRNTIHVTRSYKIFPQYPSVEAAQTAANRAMRRSA